MLFGSGRQRKLSGQIKFTKHPFLCSESNAWSHVLFDTYSVRFFMYVPNYIYLYSCLYPYIMILTLGVVVGFTQFFFFLAEGFTQAIFSDKLIVIFLATCKTSVFNSKSLGLLSSAYSDRKWSHLGIINIKQTKMYRRVILIPTRHTMLYM